VKISQVAYPVRYVFYVRGLFFVCPLSLYSTDLMINTRILCVKTIKLTAGPDGM